MAHSLRRARACALLAALAWLPACSREAQQGAEEPAAGRGVAVASVAALDWFTWLGLLEHVRALPQHAERYANGLPEGFLARGLPSFAQFRAEALLGPRPRLVVCESYQNPLTVRALRAAGVRVCVLEGIRGYASLEENARLLVAALREAEICALDAAALLARLERERDALDTADDARASVLPYYELGGQVSTAGRGTSEDLLLTLAGARNHAAALGLAGHARVPFEALLADPPDWVLVSEGPQREALLARARMQSFEAVRARRLLVLSPRLRQANSPFVLEAARRVRAQLRAASASEDARDR